MTATTTDVESPSGVAAWVTGRRVAFGTALVLAVEAGVAAVAPDASDHASTLGALSEGLAGAAFLLAALSLVLLLPRGPVARVACLPGVAATALTGVAMVSVAFTGTEWPEPVVTVLVLVNLLGFIVQGIVGWRTGVWRWWAAVLLAVFLPVMFLVPNPANSVAMALVWVGVGLAARSK